MDKYKLLKKGILLDLIGMATMLIPFWGTIVDLIWAPYAAFQINKMYRGTQGKIAAVIVFLEEILPGLDVIPTFTLMWLYTFILKKNTPDAPEKR
ncbi:MAG: hypothetical protein HON09_01735 [Flavobacteriaceae bacterium]|jgi:hypothetical protein|nr:hypothetical protein [Flavobacteriaceae bacterium]